jgi:hypothetical protein
MCEIWEDKEVFYNWAINNGYSIGLQLDRIDNDGNYTPENCRWVDRDQHSNETLDVFVVIIQQATEVLVRKGINIKPTSQ